MSTHANNGPASKKLEYNHEEFTNRDKEKEWLAEKIRQAQNGISIHQPLVNLWGVSGIGKTWLLKEIAYLYQFNPEAATLAEKPTCSAYFDFEDRDDLTITEVLLDLTQQFTAVLPEDFLKRQASPEITTTDEIDSFVGALQQLAQKVVPILLFDTTEKLSEEFWLLFEQKVLEPLLATNQILVIIAGRQRTPRWRRVEVRRRAASSAESRVVAFKDEDIQKQLAKINISVPLELADQLFILSGGSPFLAQQIAVFLQQQTDKELGVADVTRHKKQLRNILDEYKAYVLKDIKENRDELLSYLEALSVLRFYRTEALRYMIQANHLMANQPTDVQLLTILRELSSMTEVVWWEDSKNGYITAPVLRRIINQLWRMEDGETQFIDRHQQALDLYWSWVDQYPENRAIYLVEICYHQASMDQVEHPGAASLTDLEKVVEMAKRLELDKRVIVFEKLGRDEELQQILTPESYQELIDEIEKTLIEEPVAA